MLRLILVHLFLHCFSIAAAGQQPETVTILPEETTTYTLSHQLSDGFVWEQSLQADGGLQVAPPLIAGNRIFVAGSFLGDLILDAGLLTATDTGSGFFAVFDRRDGTLLRLGQLDGSGTVMCRGIWQDAFGVQVMGVLNGHHFMIPLGKQSHQIQPQVAHVRLGDEMVLRLNIVAPILPDFFNDDLESLAPLFISQSEGSVEDPSGTGTQTETTTQTTQSTSTPG